MSRVTASVLGDWVDPDGDAFYLAGASTAAPDTVSYKPEGTVVFAEGGSSSALRSVGLVVSDGRAEGTGSLNVTVKPAGQVPIIADPFEVQAYAGQEVTVSPLDHVRGGTGTLRLASVPAKSGVDITASLEAGTFTVTSTETGTHYLDYVVNDGSETANGEVRVDVAAPPDANTKPITIPKTIFVHTLSSQSIDVASTDIDPAGGVLLVTGVFNVPANSGVRAEVLEDRTVRVTLTAPLDNGPVTFNYHITNGLAEADGVITVVQIPPPARLQPPIANDDSVTVRPGDAIDIPVLANDVQPDGEDLTLDPLLSTGLKSDSGLLFASGSVLRYLAPQKTGDFTAVYQVSGPDGQVAQAQVKIAVREASEATNNPPVPQTVTARVLAGATVRIPIPLTGIDPDGDSVQLLGQETAPLKGSVTDVGPDYLDYQAGDYSAGTDSFTYTVVDALGARATGIVRVGIAPKLDGARNPVAVEDDVTMRPGATVSVQVLANDSDPDGGTLKVVKVEPNSKDIKAVISGDIVKITPPKTPGRYGLVYTIENDFGGRSSAFISVDVDPNAPRAYPQVNDTVLTLTDVLGQTQINVNVLRNVFFADGPVSGLKVSLLPGYAQSASVTAGKRIAVRVEAKSQIIPFAVANPDDPKIVSYAFVWVPGLDDALPQLNRKAPPLTVASESQLTIDLNKYVLAIGGKTVQLTDTTKVQATHSNGDPLVVNDHTLKFTSADKYFGPASISFEVTDGSSPTDPNGHVATLVLPIKVTPRQNQPPAFVGGQIDFEPGASRTIDLTKLTNYPYPNDIGELTYTVLNPLPTGFSYTLTGQTLVLTADSDAVKNSSTAIQLSVADALSTGLSGRIQLGVVASTRPLASPAPDSVQVQRGQTASVDVLANDQATNPFPGQPLTVVAIRGIGGASLPAGVSVSPSADNSHLTVTVDPSAVPGNTSLQYEVADATNDPDRYVWGTVTISVQDKPDPVSGVGVSGFGNLSLTLHWTPGSDNNSPITGYSVLMYDSTLTNLISMTPCTATICAITTPGNGSSNAVRVRVIETNALGNSTPVGFGGGATAWSDVIPAAPTGASAAPLDGGLHVTWNVVPDPANGSAVSAYYVSAGGIDAPPVMANSCSSTCSVDITGLSNGQSVGVSISAHNDAQSGIVPWNETDISGTPAGAPLQTGTPSVPVSGTTISASWGGDFSDNGRSIDGYVAFAYPATDPQPACPTSGFTADTSKVFGGLATDTTYDVIVYARNSQGCSASTPVQAETPPAVIDAAAFGGPSEHSTLWDATLSGASSGGQTFTSDYTFYYMLDDGVKRGPIALGDFLVGDGSQYGSTSEHVALLACHNTACQDSFSAPIPLSVTPVDPQVAGVQFAPASDLSLSQGTFSWLSWPSGPGYTSIQYSCNGGTSFSPADTTVAGGSCDVPVLAPLELIIRVTANGGTTYDATYDQNGTLQ
ncbi:MAG: Ig-like domain-containing protein [Actinomycetota bacterium]